MKILHSFNKEELNLIRVACRLRAEACEENSDFRLLKLWRHIEKKAELMEKSTGLRRPGRKSI